MCTSPPPPRCCRISPNTTLPRDCPSVPPPEDVLQWAVHVDRIDDRGPAVCRDVEQRVRLTVLCLRRQSFGLNDSVEALSTHPLTRVGFWNATADSTACGRSLTASAKETSSASSSPCVPLRGDVFVCPSTPAKVVVVSGCAISSRRHISTRLRPSQARIDPTGRSSDFYLVSTHDST